MNDILATIRTAFDGDDVPSKNLALRKAHDVIEQLRKTSGLTGLESAALMALVDAWNVFVQLPTEHPDDIDEFRHHIHALQMMIMARPIRRTLARREK